MVDRASKHSAEPILQMVHVEDTTRDRLCKLQIMLCNSCHCFVNTEFPLIVYVLYLLINYSEVFIVDFFDSKYLVIILFSVCTFVSGNDWCEKLFCQH